MCDHMSASHGVSDGWMAATTLPMISFPPGRNVGCVSNGGVFCSTRNTLIANGPFRVSESTGHGCWMRNLRMSALGLNAALPSITPEQPGGSRCCDMWQWGRTDRLGGNLRFHSSQCQDSFPSLWYWPLNGGRPRKVGSYPDEWEWQSCIVPVGCQRDPGNSSVGRQIIMANWVVALGGRTRQRHTLYLDQDGFGKQTRIFSPRPWGNYMASCEWRNSPEVAKARARAKSPL